MRLCWTWAFRSLYKFCATFLALGFGCLWLFTLYRGKSPPFRRRFFGVTCSKHPHMQFQNLHQPIALDHTLALSPMFPTAALGQAVQGVYQRAKSLEMRIQACCSFFSSQVGRGFGKKKSYLKWRYFLTYPIGSMYRIFTYIYHKCMANVGRYSIHGASGYPNNPCMVYFHLP